MTEELYSKATVLYDKIRKLETQKNILNGSSIKSISLRKDGWFSATTFSHIDYEHLDSIKLKEFVLNEINEKLVKFRKEFDEL